MLFWPRAGADGSGAGFFALDGLLSQMKGDYGFEDGMASFRSRRNGFFKTGWLLEEALEGAKIGFCSSHRLSFLDVLLLSSSVSRG